MSRRCGYKGCGHLVLAEGDCGDRLCPRNAERAASAGPPAPPPGDPQAAATPAAEIDTLVDPPGTGPEGWPLPTRLQRTWRSDLTAYPRPPQAERDPYPYQVTVPPEIADAELRLTGETTAAVEDAGRAIEHLNGSAAGGHYELVASPLLRSEAISSSRIEGFRASHRAVAEALESPGGARATAQAIVNNIAAMEDAIAIADEGPLTVDAIHAIHRRILAGTHLEPYGGTLRTEQNWIGPSEHGPFKAIYVPPPHTELPRLLGDLVRFTERRDLPAIAQAAIAHAQFEGIHGYVDGNGRAGRALIHVVLRQRGLTKVVPPISTVLAARQDAYFAALAGYQQHSAVDTWVRHFAEAATTAARRAEDLGGEISGLVGEWSARIGARHADSSANRILPLLVQRPIITATTAAQGLGITDTAARRVLADIDAAGVIHQITAGRRNRAWAAEEVFDLLDRFELDIAGNGDGRRPAPTRHLRRRP